MKCHLYLLRTAAMTLCFAAIATGCGNMTSAPQNHQTSRLHSVNDGSNYFIITNANNDSSSLTFYSCSVISEQETHILQNPTAHPHYCVSAFQTADGLPLTVSKQSLLSKEIQDFLTKNWQKIKTLNQITLKEMNLNDHNGNHFIYFAAMTTLSGLITLGISIITKKRLFEIASGLLSITSFIIFGYAAGSSLRTFDARYHYREAKKDHTLRAKTHFPLTIHKNIHFDTLAKENNLTSSDEYQYFQNIIKPLGSISNEYQNEVAINDTFYKNFAKFLQKLNVTTNKEISLYCLISLTKTKECNPI
ncbi:MAG: hypothetical protein OXC44_00200 [Proteobacteria bacterium]|nr:hypothetical protein [Pseudomonadota bacterium]